MGGAQSGAGRGAERGRRDRRCAALLALLVALGAAAAQSGQLAPGDPQLASGEYYDLHGHPGRAGRTLRVSLVSTEFDPYLIVLDPSGAALLEVDDSPGHGFDVHTEIELPLDGSYTLMVTSATAGETGAYTLTLEPAPDAAPATAANPLAPPTSPTTTPTTPTTPTTGAAPSAEASLFVIPVDAEGAHNTGRPRIAVDATGALHLAVPGYAGDAYYLHCPADCHDPAQLSTVTFQTEHSAGNAMIALDANGTPQVLIGTSGEVVYASCAGDCRRPEAWTVSTIVRHAADAEREVTGEAFALDPQGRPRFVMHAYRALLGIGQPRPETLYVACDVDCHDPANWRQSRMSEQIWQESTLRFGPDGRAHLATVASSDIGDIGGYMTCASLCESGRSDAWTGLGLTYAFSDRTVERIEPAISLALTSDGRPRVMLLGRDEAGSRDLSFWACDAADCTVEANWRANFLIDGDAIGAGLDLTLDRQDRPRATYNADDNIFLLACHGDCLADDDSAWTLRPVELANAIPVDAVIPYHNCNVAAWLLRYPSLALGPDELPRVAYLAEDVSGVLGAQDPRHARCTPGVDMAVGRVSRLHSLTPPRGSP